MLRTALIMLLILTLAPLANAEDTRLFPLGNRFLKDLGIDLPLPFGINIVFNRMTNNTKIDQLKLPSLGEIEGVEFSNSTSQTDAYTARADLWLLPFMNIYLIGGTLYGTSKTRVDLSKLFFMPNFIVDVEKSYSGTSLGMGTTLVYGINNWAASLDINYAETDLDVVVSKIKTFMVSPYIYYHMPINDLPVFAGVGINYLDTEQTLTAKIPVQNAAKDITAQLHIENENNWNLSLTAGVELNPHWHLVSAVGFYHCNSFLTQLSYRF